MRLGDIGPDNNTGVFVPDADDTTTIAPTLADTDGDGRTDGEEESNYSGRVDAGEGDPNQAKVKAPPEVNLLLLD